MTKYKVDLEIPSEENKSKAIELSLQLEAVQKLRAEIQTERANFEVIVTEKLGALQLKENEIKLALRALISSSIVEV